MSGAEHDIPQLLLRTTFLLTLGYMSVYWGESKVGLTRRLALLLDVSRISNPRFGVDHTTNTILEKIQVFFRGSCCILVTQDKGSATYSLRTIRSNAKQSLNSERIDTKAGSLLMAFVQNHIVLYACQLWPVIFFRGRFLAYESTKDKWIKLVGQTSANVAELLEGRSFISAPLSLKKGNGRIYVVSRDKVFKKTDALFLSHIGAHVFPIIENIELVDRMASEAAAQERKKIALDLHDTAIQPYIGLTLGLNAVRNKASIDNPLIADLDKLAAMAAQVIGDLRRYAGTFKNRVEHTEPIFHVALRQQAAQVREFYGIDIAVSMEGEFNLSDRLIAEVLQIVREGLSNICKHTMAQHGSVKLECINGWLMIQIQNESIGTHSIDFMPRSIKERTAVLGGNTLVKQGQNGSTTIHVEIPI